MAIEPLIIADGIYSGTQIKRALKISDAKLRTWRKNGLRHTPHCKGAFYVGRDIINFLSPSSDDASPCSSADKCPSPSHDVTQRRS